MGNILFAVKANPEVEVLKQMGRYGLKRFDVASIDEVLLVRSILPDAELYFMHPVKSRQAIHRAYSEYGIRHFSLDCLDELTKIKEETGDARDLTLHVRLSVPNCFSELSLSGKFGVDTNDAPALIKEVSKYAQQVGISFHVGSQCMHPDSYATAIQIAKDALRRAKVRPDFFNIGGGFPSIYPGMLPQSLNAYFDRIHQALESLDDYQAMTFLAEPGRALVAESMSEIVRVDLRKENILYINDGTYGSLFDAGSPNFIFPTRLITPLKNPSLLTGFQLYGPTCDAMDFMKGLFYIPEEVKEGDYLEIGQVGAYGKTLASTFNGFGPSQEIRFVSNPPILSMYE